MVTDYPSTATVTPRQCTTRLTTLAQKWRASELDQLLVELERPCPVQPTLQCMEKRALETLVVAAFSREVR